MKKLKEYKQGLEDARQGKEPEKRTVDYIRGYAWRMASWLTTRADYLAEMGPALADLVGDRT